MQGSVPLSFVVLVSAAMLVLSACDRPDAARPAQGTDGSSLFPVTVDGQWGFIDASGDVIVEPRFDRAWRFSEGLALVQQGDRYGYIHPDGQFAIDPRFHDALFFSEGLAPVQIEDGTWGYIDTEGAFVVEPRFHLDPSTNEKNGSRFDNGLVPTRSGDRYGFRGRDGDERIEARFDNAWYFADGLARVRVDDSWGYIGTDGEWVIEPRFDRAWDFDDGVAMVEVGGRTGYIDRTGAYVWEPTR
jgi:hypothetical protein